MDKTNPSILIYIEISRERCNGSDDVQSLTIMFVAPIIINGEYHEYSCISWLLNYRIPLGEKLQKRQTR